MPKNVMMLLDYLEEMATSNPHFIGKVLLDQEELAEIIEKIRTGLPEEIREAEWVAREKERYLAQAQEEANRIIREAEGYAARLVREDRITSQAEEQGQQILERTYQEAEKIKADARRFAAQVLRQLEERLEKALAIAQQGQEDLAPQEE
jgi:cell division septum initiation protein DivIVA